MVSTRKNIRDTPKRWRSALKRARKEGVEIRQLQGSGMWIATSISDPNTAYEVTPWECECSAGQFHDPICKHRAALLAKLGRLRLQEDFSMVAPIPCPSCRGTGALGAGTGIGWRSSSDVTCTQCNGSGFASIREAA